MAATTSGAVPARLDRVDVDHKASGRLFDVAALEADAKQLSTIFVAARPYPHIVVDDLLLLPPEAGDEFPGPDWQGWSPLGDSYQHNKHFCNDIELIPNLFSDLIGELSSPRFLRVLETVTGIPRLLPDPYLNGGGLHLSGPGGILTPHTDFHHYKALELYRRVNVLIYLNDDWDESRGGCLDLIDEVTGEQKRIVPQWGRCVVFATDDKSVHGFSIPVADGNWRRSIALYYYTATDTSGFSGDSTTFWRDHGSQRMIGRGRIVAYKGLLKASRAISILAHLINPNQGAALLRTRLATRSR